jgi:hypothetical protein
MDADRALPIVRLQRAVDLVERGHCTIFQHCLVQPSAFYGMDLGSAAYEVIEPERCSPGSSLPLRWRVEMRSHSITNAGGSQSNVENLAAVVYERVASRLLWDHNMIGPCKLGSLARKRAELIDFHPVTEIFCLRYLEH